MGRKVLIGFVIVLAALAMLYVLGPRVPVDTTVSFDATTIGADPDAYLAAAEANVPNIRPDHQKQIVWADAATKARTPIAIVYIHGFSASKWEIRPVPDRVAAELGANLYFTRLTGHGQDGASMATASVNAWLNDYAEAMAIGRLLGDRVIVVATSTGGGLATWAAAQPALAEGLAGLVLISPNYQIQAGSAAILTMPWGGLIADLATGGTRGFEPSTELHGRYWTTTYPTSATLPLAAITKLARETPVETITVPALFMFSAKDTVVRPESTRVIAERWGAAHEIVTIDDSADPSNHVLAGDALSPGTTDQAVETIVSWVKALR